MLSLTPIWLHAHLTTLAMGARRVAGVGEPAAAAAVVAEVSLGVILMMDQLCKHIVSFSSAFNSSISAPILTSLLTPYSQKIILQTVSPRCSSSASPAQCLLPPQLVLTHDGTGGNVVWGIVPIKTIGMLLQIAIVWRVVLAHMGVPHNAVANLSFANQVETPVYTAGERGSVRQVVGMGRHVAVAVYIKGFSVDLLLRVIDRRTVQLEGRRRVRRLHYARRCCGDCVTSATARMVSC